MAYVAVDEDENEIVFSKGERLNPLLIMTLSKITTEIKGGKVSGYKLRDGNILNAIGRKLTWEDEPVELKEQQ